MNKKIIDILESDLLYLFLYWFYPEHFDIYLSNYVRWHSTTEFKYNERSSIYMPAGILKIWCKLLLWYKIKLFDNNSLERILPNGKPDCLIVVSNYGILFKLWRKSNKSGTILFEFTRYIS